MNVNPTEYDTEYTFYAYDEWDQIIYTYFLWFQKQTPAQQQESRQEWQRWTEGNPKVASKPIPKRMLFGTGAETPSRTRKSIARTPRSRKRTTKGLGQMEMQQLRETNESNGVQGCDCGFCDGSGYYC